MAQINTTNGLNGDNVVFVYGGAAAMTNTSGQANSYDTIAKTYTSIALDAASVAAKKPCTFMFRILPDIDASTVRLGYVSCNAQTLLMFVQEGLNAIVNTTQGMANQQPSNGVFDCSMASLMPYAYAAAEPGNALASAKLAGIDLQTAMACINQSPSFQAMVVSVFNQYQADQKAAGQPTQTQPTGFTVAVPADGSGFVGAAVPANCPAPTGNINPTTTTPGSITPTGNTTTTTTTPATPTSATTKWLEAGAIVVGVAGAGVLGWALYHHAQIKKHQAARAIL